MPDDKHQGGAPPDAGAAPQGGAPPDAGARGTSPAGLRPWGANPGPALPSPSDGPNFGRQPPPDRQRSTPPDGTPIGKRERETAVLSRGKRGTARRSAELLSHARELQSRSERGGRRLSMAQAIWTAAGRRLQDMPRGSGVKR